MVTDIFPIFAVRNFDEALTYYRDQLGFTVAWTFGEPPHHAGVRLDRAEIQLVAAGPGAPQGTGAVYCHMTGLDAYYQSCRERGANISQDLAPRPWGVRDFRVLDPSGNRLGFAELLPK